MISTMTTQNTKNMDPLQFCYWLQGFAEINGAPPTEAQWSAIRDHLQLVFEKKTPQYNLRGPATAGLGPLDNSIQNQPGAIC